MGEKLFQIGECINTSNKCDLDILHCCNCNHLDNDEIKIFFKALPTWRDKLIFKIALFTGARISEVLNIEIKDITCIDTTENGAVIQYAMHKDIKVKVNDMERKIYIPIELLIEIHNFINKERINIDTDYDFLFVVNEGKSLGRPLTFTIINKVFDTVKKKTGIPLCLRDLRHIFIANLVVNKVDIDIIRELSERKYITSNRPHSLNIADKFYKDKLSEIYKYIINYAFNNKNLED